MLPNAYLPITNLGLTSRYNLRGSIRRCWLATRSSIVPGTWQPLLPATNTLPEPPQLYAGREWLGPLAHTTTKSSFSEVTEPTPSGELYKQTIKLFFPGTSLQHHLNTAMLRGQQFVGVVQPRHLGQYLVLGGPNHYLRVKSIEDTTGDSRADAPGTSLVLYAESHYKSYVLAGFPADDACTPIPTGCTPYIDTLPSFVGLKTYHYWVTEDDVNLRQNYVILPQELHNTTLEGVERSGAQNLQIRMDGEPPAHERQALWVPATGHLYLHPDYPLSPGEDLFLLYRP